MVGVLASFGRRVTWWKFTFQKIYTSLIIATRDVQEREMTSIGV